MKRLLVLAVAALAAAPGAQAKGPTTVCGAFGCAELATEAATFEGAMRMSVAPGTPMLATVAPAPSFRIRGMAISRNGYLLRDGRIFRISKALAKRVLARRAI